MGGSDMVRVGDVQEVECAEGEYCMRELYFANSGRHGLSQACTSTTFKGAANLAYEATVGGCCRQSANRIASSYRVMFYDSDPGVLAGDARMAFMEQYDDIDDNYSECPCYCKYRPSETSRRRTWWSTRRRPNAGAVAAQARCPFASDFTDDATISPTLAPTLAPTTTTTSDDAIDVVTIVEVTFPGNLSNLNATVQEALKAAVVAAVQEVDQGDATYTVVLRPGSIIAVITVIGTAADTASLVSYVDANPISVAVPGYSATSTSAALATASKPADAPLSGAYAPAQATVAVMASISLFAIRAGQL